MRFRKARGRCRSWVLLGCGLAGLSYVEAGCQMKGPQDPSAQLWTRQLGTTKDDAFSAAAVSGNYIYAAGRTAGRLSDYTGSTAQTDALLASLDQNGTVVWQKQYGSAGNEEWRGVATDAAGNAYVVGYTDSVFAGQTQVGGDTDAVIARIRPDGSLDWVRQFGTIAADYLLAVTVDSAGNAYAAGWTAGTFMGQTLSGTSDGFVVKYRADGTQEWLTQFGCPKEDSLNSIALLGGALYVSGWATDSVGAGQQALGGRDAALYKVQPGSGVSWARQFGSNAIDEGLAVTVDATNVYVAGRTMGALPNQTNAGRSDAIVAAYDLSGTQRWVQQFGTMYDDELHAAAAASDGSGVYVGGMVGLSFLGATWVGQADALYTKLRSDGNQDWASQFGTTADDMVLGLQAPGVGTLYAVGSTGESLNSQMRVGGVDAFVGRFSVP